MLKKYNYSKQAYKMQDRGASWSRVAEQYTEQFENATRGLWDTARDVGAVMLYYKGSKEVGHFDYENFWGQMEV